MPPPDQGIRDIPIPAEEPFACFEACHAECQHPPHKQHTCGCRRSACVGSAGGTCGSGSARPRPPPPRRGSTPARTAAATPALRGSTIRIRRATVSRISAASLGREPSEAAKMREMVAHHQPHPQIPVCLQAAVYHGTLNDIGWAAHSGGKNSNVRKRRRHGTLWRPQRRDSRHFFWHVKAAALPLRSPSVRGGGPSGRQSGSGIGSDPTRRASEIRSLVRGGRITHKLSYWK